MTYFGRLAQRVGAAMPRALVTPVGAPAAASAPDVAGLESVTEVTVSGTPATIAQPAAQDSASSLSPEAAPAAVSAVRPHRHDDHAAPDLHDMARAVSPPAPREWEALDSPLPPSAQPEQLRPASRPAPEAVREMLTETVALAPLSDVPQLRGPIDPAPRTQMPEAPTAALSIPTMTTEIEAPQPLRTANRAPTDRPRTTEGPNASLTPPRARQQMSLEAEGDIVAPSRTIVPAVVRGRDDRDTAQRRSERAPPATLRAPAAKSARESSIEVRIGAVTLQVHAPPAPVAPQAPARTSFAPHRHYLRTW